MVVAVYVCLVTKHEYIKNPLSWASFNVSIQALNQIRPTSKYGIKFLSKFGLGSPS